MVLYLHVTVDRFFLCSFVILIDVPIALAHDEGGANGGGNQGTVFSIVNFCTSNSWMD